jgi:ubiquitin C-terminal hydrolase
MTFSLISNHLPKEIGKIIKNKSEDKWVSSLKKADGKKMRGQKLSKLCKVVLNQVDFHKNSAAKKFVGEGYKWLDRHSGSLSTKAKQRLKEIGPLYKKAIHKKTASKDKPKTEKPASTNPTSKAENLSPKEPKKQDDSSKKNEIAASPKQLSQVTDAQKNILDEQNKKVEAEELRMKQKQEQPLVQLQGPKNPAEAPVEAPVLAADPIDLLKGALQVQSDVAKSSLSSHSPSTPFIARGITNIGNSCYMNASLQALGQCPGLIEMLAEKQDAAHNPKALEINCFRQQVLTFLQELQKKEKAIPDEFASHFMDFLISKGWSSKKEKFHAQDAYPFFQFLLDSLHLDSKIYGCKVGTSSEACSLRDLLFPADLTKGKKNNLFLSENKKCDFLVIAVEMRFHLGLFGEDQKNQREVRPCLSLELPYKNDETKKENYKLAAIVVNPASDNDDGHYVTYAPHGDKWIEFNDSRFLVHEALDPQALSKIQQHSYLYLYKRSPKTLE